MLLQDLKIQSVKIQKHSKSRLFKIRFQRVGLWLWSQPFEKLTIQNPDIIARISNVLKNGFHFSGFQMGGLPNFRSHSKSRPFPNMPLSTTQNPKAFRLQILTAVKKIHYITFEFEQLKEFDLDRTRELHNLDMR